MLPIEFETLQLPRGHTKPRHVHSTGQLICVTEGAIMCESEAMQWHMMSRQAAWIPPGLAHGAVALSPLTATLARIDVRRLPGWPEGVAVVHASQLLAGAVQRLQERLAHRWDAAAGPLAAVLADELAMLAPLPQKLPLPAHPRLRRLAGDMLSGLEAAWTLDATAARYGYSRSTLNRAFVRETGLPLGRWLLCARMNAARLLIDEGRTVSETAERVGYGTVSGFCAAFRQYFGASPTALERQA